MQLESLQEESPISGIAWNGGSSITAIQNNLDHMKKEVAEAVADKNFLKQQYDNLKGFYNSTVQDANSKISQLVKERDSLYSQVETLKQQADTTDEKAELQAEIDRLESELDKANQQIASLQTYAANADADINYTAMTSTEKTAYTATEQKVQGIPVPIDSKASAIDATKAAMMADPTQVTKIQNDIKATFGSTSTITGVTATSGGKFAYKVTAEFSKGSLVSPNSFKDLATKLGYTGLYFVSESGREIFISN